MEGNTALQARNDRTLIAKKTTVIGDIISSEPLSIEGIVNGSVSTESVIGITGQINGDVDASKVTLAGRSAHVMGTVKAYDTADVLEGAAVIGDVVANGDISVNGLIKGNVSSDSTVNVANSAYISGNVIAKNVHIADGSKIRGRVEIKLDNDQFEEENLLAEVERIANEQVAIRKSTQPHANNNIIDVQEEIEKSAGYYKKNKHNNYNKNNNQAVTI